MILLICGILRNDTHELIYKTEILTDIENKLIATKYQRGEAGRGGGGGVVVTIHRRLADFCGRCCWSSLDRAGSRTHLEVSLELNVG